MRSLPEIARVAVCCAAPLVAGVSGVACRAQAPTASIEGLAIDAAGAALVGAHIVVLDRATGAER